MKPLALIMMFAVALLTSSAIRYVPFQKKPVLPVNVACAGGGTIVNVGADVQTAINTAGEGGKLCFQQGVYRVGLGSTGRAPVMPMSGQTYNCSGPPGSCILDGSLVITGWKPSGNYYVAAGRLPSAPNGATLCESAFPLCNHSEDIYMDGTLLTPVASAAALTPGTFYNNYSANLITLYDNPAGHTIEQAYQYGIMWTQTSSGSNWIYHPINNVTIDGLGFQKAANGYNFAAVQSRQTTGWVLRNVFAQFNHAAALSIGDQSSITYSTINNNGQLCINMATVNTQLVDHVTCNYNNTARYQGNYSAGGIKAGVSQNVTISNSTFIGNYGIGIWFDISCWNNKILHNYVQDSWYVGIIYEISSLADIEYNTIINSTIGRPQPTVHFYDWGALMISVSDHVTVAHNTIVTNANGLGVNMQARTTTCVYNPPYPPDGTHYPDGSPLCYTNIIPAGSHTTLNVDVFDNTVTSNASPTGGIAPMAGMNSDMNVNYPDTAPLMYTSQGIHFHDNTYCMPDASGLWFTWSYNHDINHADWRATGNDTTGVFKVKGVSC